MTPEEARVLLELVYHGSFGWQRALERNAPHARSLTRRKIVEWDIWIGGWFLSQSGREKLGELRSQLLVEGDKP